MFPIHLFCISLGYGHSEETNMDRTCKLHTERTLGSAKTRTGELLAIRCSVGEVTLKSNAL